MSGPSIEFRKIWIEQCAATEAIRERFGLESALDYLIGEKIFSFVMASERDPISPQSSRRSFTFQLTKRFSYNFFTAKYFRAPVQACGLSGKRIV